ncbi:hypothetical protein AAG906_035474 [Vitis piasezkii]
MLTCNTQGGMDFEYDRKSELKAFDDLKLIPRMFIHPPHNLHEKSVSTNAQLSIPIIDLEGVNSDAILCAKIVDKVRNAYEHEVEWIVDTATSYHATPHLVLFSYYRVGNFDTVKMGNFSHSKIVGMGDVCFETNMGCRLTLKDVRHLIEGSLVVAKEKRVALCTRPKVKFVRMIGKQHRVSFNNRSKKLEKLELEYSNVCGRMFMATLEEIETSLPLLMMLSGREFETYCTKYGMRHEKIISGTPQHNGVAKRMNHTIIERDPTNKKSMRSRDVVFQEGQTLGDLAKTNQSKGTNDDFVELVPIPPSLEQPSNEEEEIDELLKDDKASNIPIGAS